jgi:hypothetical protein
MMKKLSTDIKINKKIHHNEAIIENFYSNFEKIMGKSKLE